jgi:hypothetical protein
VSPSVLFASYPNLAFAPLAGLYEVNEAALGALMVVESPLPRTKPWPLMPASLLPLRWGRRCPEPSGSWESTATKVALKGVRANAHTTSALPSVGQPPRIIRFLVFPPWDFHRIELRYFARPAPSHAPPAGEELSIPCWYRFLRSHLAKQP